MGLIDSSWYYSEEEVDIGTIDYSSVLTRAEKAGYEIEGFWPWPGNSSGFKPGDVPEIRETFGNAVLVQNIRLNYDQNSELMVFVCEEGSETRAGTCVSISNFSHSDPGSSLQPSEFPDDSWMLEKIGLLFNLDEKASEKYLEDLKKAAQNQTWDAEIQVNESTNFPAVYAYLMENSDGSDYESSMGFNAYPTEAFLKDGTRIGSVKYLVPQAKVITYDKKNKYIVELDASGKVKLEIIMLIGSSGDTIPEEEYRAVFRKIFKELGLSPEAVDKFEFFASSSRIW